MDKGVRKEQETKKNNRRRRMNDEDQRKRIMGRIEKKLQIMRGLAGPKVALVGGWPPLAFFAVFGLVFRPFGKDEDEKKKKK